MTGAAPMCMWCVHFRDGIGPIGAGGGRTGPLGSAAFPKPPGIPKDILRSRHDHRTPYAGDHDIRFEPKDAEAAAWAERLFPSK